MSHPTWRHSRRASRQYAIHAGRHASLRHSRRHHADITPFTPGVTPVYAIHADITPTSCHQILAWTGVNANPLANVCTRRCRVGAACWLARGVLLMMEDENPPAQICISSYARIKLFSQVKTKLSYLRIWDQLALSFSDLYPICSQHKYSLRTNILARLILGLAWNQSQSTPPLCLQFGCRFGQADIVDPGGQYVRMEMQQ